MTHTSPSSPDLSNSPSLPPVLMKSLKLNFQHIMVIAAGVPERPCRPRLRLWNHIAVWSSAAEASRLRWRIMIGRQIDCFLQAIKTNDTTIFQVEILHLKQLQSKCSVVVRQKYLKVRVCGCMYRAHGIQFKTDFKEM